MGTSPESEAKVSALVEYLRRRQRYIDDPGRQEAEDAAREREEWWANITRQAQIEAERSSTGRGQ